MKIEIGTTYKNGWGNEREIRGLAKCEPIDGERVFWALSGDWYTESGRAVSYDKHAGHVLRTPYGTSNYDLKEWH